MIDTSCLSQHCSSTFVGCIYGSSMQTSVPGHAFQSLGYLSFFSSHYCHLGDQSLDPVFVSYRFVQTAVKSSDHVSLCLYLLVRIQPDSGFLRSTEN